MKKMTIKEQVIAEKQIILEMNSTKDLREYAISKGWDSRSEFSHFKKALKFIGVDYDFLKKSKEEADRKDFLKKVKFEITLFSDFKLGKNRFSVCGENAEIWYGMDFDCPIHQAEGELNSAKKAVWLAGKAKQLLGEEAIRLNLYVDADWLTYQDNEKQKGYILTTLAKKYNVDLNISWISGKDNPADFKTTTRGLQKWQEVDLKSFCSPITKMVRS